MSEMNPYDDVPYQSKPVPYASAERLEVMAVLHGLEATPVPECRVLELGCAEGGHLLPMAARHPKAQFVGVDLSARQISDAKAAAASAGLTNIRFEEADLSQLGDLGQFDYIIAHGVYSWVPGPVREAMLKLCAERLTPRGVAYLSYNAYPGWHIRGIVRDAMMFHTREMENPEQRIAQATAILRFLEENTPEDTYWHKIFEVERKHLDHPGTDAYIMHEMLSPENQPFWFEDFVAAARRNGVDYLTDAEWSGLDDSLLDDKALKFLYAEADPIKREQLRDWIVGQTFRRSLLVHPGRDPHPKVAWGHLLGLYVVGSLEAVGPVDLQSGIKVKFRSHLNPDAAHVEIGASTLKCALQLLWEDHPQGLKVEEICAKVAAKLGVADDQTLLEDLADSFLFLFGRGYLDLAVRPQPFVHRPSERPRTTQLVRWRADAGMGGIDNLRHQWCAVDPFDARLLAHCDGKHDLAQLIDAVVADLSVGRLAVNVQGGGGIEAERLRALVADRIPQRLSILARGTVFDG